MERIGFNYNLLLEYLSYKKYGTWQDFKKYVENLSFDNISDTELKYRKIELCRMLSSLGHVEFMFGEKSYYSICPPAIALFNNAFSGVLCGYRTPEFLESLKMKCKEFNVDFTEKEMRNSPKVIIIDFKNQDTLNKFTSKYDQNFISISPNFSLTLMSRIPSINDIVDNLQPIKFDRDEYDVKIFNRNYRNDSFSFVNARGIGECDWSVYEVPYLSHKEYILYGNDNKYYKTDKSIALCKYFSENYNKVCYYSYNNKALILKNSRYSNYIPELIDRALTLSSGLNRITGNNNVVYCNISPELADITSEKMGLCMREKNEK